MEKAKFILDEKDMPTAWYNIIPDLPEPLPPEVHPGTKQPCPFDMPLSFFLYRYTNAHQRY